MARLFRMLALGAALCAAGLLSAAPQEKKTDKPEIKDGIEGHVKKVDAEKGTLVIALPNGKERSFTITEDTTILGPRGGVVRKRLKDHRFHEGLEITVVANGATATELHLGFDRGQSEDSVAKPKTPATPAAGKGAEPASSKAGKAATPPAENQGARTTTSRKPAEEDEDEEFPGKIKSVDASRHMLVITLLNGKDRSFLLASDLTIHVDGAVSKQGLSDPAVKVGAPITVTTDSAGKKVKEVNVKHSIRTKKAG